MSRVKNVIKNAIKFFHGNFVIYKHIVRCFFIVYAEYRSFVKLYALGARCICIVIDNSCSPPTYGDSVFAAMLARYSQRLGLQVYFYIVEGSPRSDWNYILSTEKVACFIAERLNLVSCIIGSKDVVVQTIKWDGFIDILDNKSSSLIVPFDKQIRKRSPVYHHYGRLLNMLFNRQDRIPSVDFLLTASDFPEKELFRSLPSKPFITIGCRYSNYWSPERNLSESEFIDIITKLSANWPGHELMILSCSDGCTYFRALAQANELDVLFSKDYSSSLLGDAHILLRGKFFFVLKGGGISIFAQCSNIPFECYQLGDKSLIFRPHMFFSWNDRHQIFKNTDKLPKSFLDFSTV